MSSRFLRLCFFISLETLIALFYSSHQLLMLLVLFLHKVVPDLLLGHCFVHVLWVYGLLRLGSIHVLRPWIWPNNLGLLRLGSLLGSPIGGITLIIWKLLALVLRLLRCAVLLLPSVAILVVIPETSNAVNSIKFLPELGLDLCARVALHKSKSQQNVVDIFSLFAPIDGSL